MSDEDKKLVLEIGDDKLDEVSGGRGGGSEGISISYSTYRLDRPCPVCGSDLWIRSSPLGGGKYYFVCKSCNDAGRIQRVEAYLSDAH